MSDEVAIKDGDAVRLLPHLVSATASVPDMHALWRMEAAWASDVASSLHLNTFAYLQVRITTLRLQVFTFVALSGTAAFHPRHWSGKMTMRKGRNVIWQVTADRGQLQSCSPRTTHDMHTDM